MKKWVSTLILLFVFSLSQSAFAADWRPVEGVKDTFWNAEGLKLISDDKGVVEGDLVVVSLKRPVNPEFVKKKVKKIEKKIEIMQKFRDNINTMGKAVAAGLLSSIEKIATENFRRMTGRSEEINWINGEKESYAVYLKGEERGNTRFEVLSGGEQVAVALSIRAAMASTMTNANFAIFDEPTINLDKIRKEALSESLKEILKDLEQAIIVTHDDLFEEMAERIIIIE